MTWEVVGNEIWEGNRVIARTDNPHDAHHIVAHKINVEYWKGVSEEYMKKTVDLAADKLALQDKVQAVLTEMREYMEVESYNLLTPDGAGIFHLVEEYASKLEDALRAAE